MLKTHHEPAKPTPIASPVVLALGFRPFFILSGLSAVTLLLLWLSIWSGSMSAPQYYGMIGWHSHEMLFGYTSAVIAGFLLSAVVNWTGVNTPNGKPLAMLAGLWMLGRVMPFIESWVPNGLIALTDLLFLPAVALAIQPALWKGKQRINRIFVPVLLLMGITNAYVHLEATGFTSTGHQGNDAMLFMVIGLITLLGGRVIPFFTESAIPGYQAKRYKPVELTAIILIAAIVLIQLISPSSRLTGLLAIGIALSQLVRLAGWYHPGIWKNPILWVLFTAMLWVVIGFLLLALASQGVLAESLAKHAITIGGIGVLTLGMMARVSLGHTGRPIQSHPIINGCFLLLNLACLIRVIAPLLAPQHYNLWIYLSGGAWVICFALFCIIYLPMLTRRRIDGKAG